MHYIPNRYNNNHIEIHYSILVALQCKLGIHVVMIQISLAKITFLVAWYLKLKSVPAIKS